MLFKEAKKHFKTHDSQLPMLYQMCWAETVLNPKAQLQYTRHNSDIQGTNLLTEAKTHKPNYIQGEYTVTQSKTP